jgi:hypothetical protein
LKGDVDAPDDFDDFDDFDDEPMTDLMRSWGEKVRSEGPDRASMQVALDRVDAGIAPSWRTWRGVTAIAAAVLAGLLIWQFVGGGGLPSLTGDAPMLRDLVLSKERDMVRGRPAPEFTKGDPLFVHYYTERGGFATVVLVRPPSRAFVLTPRPIALSQDDEPLGPFELRGAAGLAGIVILTSEVAPSEADILQLVDAAAGALRANPPTTAAELRTAIDSALHEVPGVRAVTISFVLRAN